MKNLIEKLDSMLGGVKKIWIATIALILGVVSLQSCYNNTHFTETYVPDEDKLTVPLYFTPDGDGVDDYWMIESRGDWDKFMVLVYNKKNELIWETNDPRNEGFDGTYVDFYTGELVTSDTYFIFAVWAKEDGSRYYKDGVFINKLNDIETY